jgi:hypothetical protein
MAYGPEAAISAVNSYVSFSIRLDARGKAALLYGENQNAKT